MPFSSSFKSHFKFLHRFSVFSVQNISVEQYMFCLFPSKILFHGFMLCCLILKTDRFCLKSSFFWLYVNLFLLLLLLCSKPRTINTCSVALLQNITSTRALLSCLKGQSNSNDVWLVRSAQKAAFKSQMLICSLLRLSSVQNSTTYFSCSAVLS